MPESGPVRIRPGTPEDVPALVALVEASMGTSPTRTEAYWTWKHGRNPFGASPVLVAEADGRVVALRAFMRWEFVRDGDVVPAVRAVDVATDRAWRRRGLFTRLTRKMIERVRAEGRLIGFSTPNVQSTPGHVKVGWTVLKRPTRWVRPLRPLRLLKGLMGARSDSREPSSLPLAAEVLGGLQPEGYSAPSGGERRLTTHRTPAYLRWRYAEIPHYTYKALTAGEDAAAIFRITDAGPRCALLISELLVPAPDEGCRLLQGLLREADADYAMALAAWGTPEQQALAHSGFVPLPRQGPVVTVLPLADSAPASTALSQWRFSLGDLEIL